MHNSEQDKAQLAMQYNKSIFKDSFQLKSFQETLDQLIKNTYAEKYSSSPAVLKEDQKKGLDIFSESSVFFFENVSKESASDTLFL